MPDTVRVAVVQAEPEWLDLPAAVKKTCELIGDAATSGAKFVAFSECWLPGYPAWIWVRPVDFVLGTKYLKNSLAVDSSEMRTIQAAAKQHKISVLLGFSENYHNSLYMAQALINAQGEIVMKRRKIKPSHMERTVFGDASGDSLKNVAEIEGVGRVGALNCWEHTQPLLKYHTFHQREEIHVAGWPPLTPHPGGPGLWSMSSEGCESLSRTYAIEGTAFVLHATTVLTEKGIRAMGVEESPLFNQPGGGHSAVFGPGGRKLSTDKTLAQNEEGVLFADLEFDAMLASKTFMDTCGHYSRPDLLWLGVDDREKKHRRGVGEADVIEEAAEKKVAANGHFEGKAASVSSR